MPENYSIDNAKNDIQNLQDQNSYDFQEIKRLDRLINDYGKRVTQAINLNNQINKKIQYDYENSKHLIQTDIENIVNELMRDLGGLDSSQVAKLETAYNHSQTAHLTINDVNNLLGNISGSTVNTNINVVTPGFIGNETFYEFDDISNEYMTKSDNKTLEITSKDFLKQFYDIYVGEYDGLTVTKNLIGYDNTNTYPVYEYDFIPKNYSRTILLTSGMHTYELSASFGLAYFIKDYMTKPNAHKGFSYIRQNVRMKVIPIVNPWGFNQSPKVYGNVNGVNPNRNFDVNGSWETYPNNPGNEWNYKGTSAFSEQETKNIVNWLYYNKDIAEFWIDCHTGYNDANNDIWVVYVTPTPLEPKINSVINKLKNRFKSYYGVSNPVVNSQINLDSSIKHKFSENVMGIPVISLEQSPLRKTFKSGNYNNNGGAIREYACQLYAFIQEFLNCESKSIGLLEYISELNHKIMDNSCRQIVYYPSEPYMKFVNAPHINYEFVGNGGQSSTPTIKTYTITYNLNGVTSSNITKTITENSNYSSTLSADNNLTINSVSVIMGGVNVTDSVYSNNVINIDNVTGNIVITASAIIEGGNEGDNEGGNSIIKCKNVSITSSDGSETPSTTRIGTDFIPVTISGNLSINSLTTENYRFVVRYYDVNKNYLGNNGEWKLDGTKVNISPTGNDNFAITKYIRIVYKSNESDNLEINTISGTLEVEDDGIYKTLIMSDY